MEREYFKILAPFRHIDDVRLLKDAGADELYCGYVPEELSKKWPLAFNIVNRRGEGASFESYELFEMAVKQADRYNLPVYVTINGLYTPEQYPSLLYLLEEINQLKGVRGIIVADLGFLLTLKEKKFEKEIHISIGAAAFNSNTVDFYGGLGADRIILPRELTLHEIEDIITEKKSRIDIEIFIIWEGCGGFIDGYCTFFHCLEKEGSKKHQIEKVTFLHRSFNTEQESRGCSFFKKELSKGNFRVFNATSDREKKNHLRFQLNKHQLIGCRLCDLYGLKKYFIKSLKIIGRGQESKDTVDLVKIVSQALSYLEDSDISQSDYQLKCKDLFSREILNNKRRCTKFDCYFSPHWVKNER